MNASLWKIALGAGGFAAAGLPAFAGPLQRADVPAEPAWVLHVDCDSLGQTATGQYLLAEMEKPEGQARFAVFQTIFNFDPHQQLHGLTLYSTDNAREEEVLLVYADFDPDRLTTIVKTAEDYQSATYKQHVIHNWIDEKKGARDGVKPRTYAAIQGAHIVVLARQKAPVARALDVLDRTAPNLAGSGLFPQPGAGGAGNCIEADAWKLDFSNSDPTAVLFRLAKMGRLWMGEAHGQVKGTLSLEADDEEVARLMASVGQGVLALMKLQKDNPGWVKLAKGLALKRDGTHVIVSLAMPVTEAIELLKADDARKARKKAKQN